jgi:hypothetical protein
MKVSRILFIIILGPLIAFFAVWQQPFSIARISQGEQASLETVDALRAVPGDAVLRELREIAVSYPRFDVMEDDEVLDAADEMLGGGDVPGELGRNLGVPFEPGPHLFGESSWHLDLHSFSIPSLLGRAYEVSGNAIYIRAAAEYIGDWARFESSLLAPRGYFFNDHATAARSIVVAEIWRQYRNSDAYEQETAADVVRYVQKLMGMLADDRLYEYRSNHGIMQNLSILHLSIAFPLLQPSRHNWQVGKNRLLSQLEYYINEEGVILEHSPGYHHNGLRRLAAAWRYLGLNGDPVPQDFVVRYQKALEFQNALYRPDRTLPPVGDTGDYTYSPIRTASFNDDFVATGIHAPPQAAAAPEPVAAAPGAGWAILWDGLEHWPDSAKLAQTAVHWGNFPTKAHKHADELGVSIWSKGVQWVRGVGYWPYGNSRVDATGWRSSNGPHWSDESAADERYSSLVGSVLDEAVTFLHLLRTNENGERIHRQLVKIHDDLWIVLDSFESHGPKSAEVVWRLSPDIVLTALGGNELLLAPGHGRQKMRMLIDGSTNVTVDPDVSGSSPWNSGLLVDREIGKSPAVRVTSLGRDAEIVTIFRLATDNDGKAGTFKIVRRWDDATSWQISVVSTDHADVNVERRAETVHITVGEAAARPFRISTEIAEAAIVPRDLALQAFDRNNERHDDPFRPRVPQRAKASLVIVVVAAAQLILLFIVRLKQDKLMLPLAIYSSIAWLGLSLFLGLHYFS